VVHTAGDDAVLTQDGSAPQHGGLRVK